MTASASLERLQQLLPELFNPKQSPGNPYLRFQLSPNFLALLSMEQVQESLLVPNEQITPLPNMPSSVLGLLNSRGTVFCVIDLPHLMNLSESQMNLQRYQVIVVQVFSNESLASLEQELFLGLAVPLILGVTRFVAEDIYSPFGDVPVSIQPFVSGCVFAEEQPIVVLDVNAISAAPSLLSV